MCTRTQLPLLTQIHILVKKPLSMGPVAEVSLPQNVSSALTTRQAGVSSEVKALSWRMQNRLHTKYIKLKLRKKEENKSIVSVARELSGFLWELMNKCNLPIPEYANAPLK